MDSETPRCRGTRRDGTACQSPASSVGADGYCWAHSPAKRTERRAARAKGGRHRASAERADKLLPAYMKPVLHAVLAALRDVRDGSLSAPRGTAIASLASAAVRIYAAALVEQRVEELQAQCDRLRELYEVATGGRPA